jgi:uncharacterized coiled-coil protein SlyX
MKAESKLQELEKRLNELEFLIAHLERGCEALDDVVTRQADEIDELQRQINRLRQQLAAAKSDESDDETVEQ